MRSGRSEANAFQQWYQRRKLDALCYVGHKFEDPVGHEESCPCTDDDYEWSVGIPFVNAPRLIVHTATSTMFARTATVWPQDPRLYQPELVTGKTTNTLDLLGTA